MLELKGKYNTAKIYTDNCDNETISQIMNLLNQESCKGSQIRIMPDTHAGAGCVIGTTMILTDKVVPNLVGVDIGCGMLSIPLKEKHIDYKKLDAVIHKYVPSGCSIHSGVAKGYFNFDKIIAPIDKERAMHSIGTLGGGNHFIGATRS